MGIFKDVKLKVAVRSRGRMPPSHDNGLILRSESRTDEHFEQARLSGISISSCHLTRCVFSDVHAESVSLGGGQSQSVYTDCVFNSCDFVFSAVGNVRLLGCRFEDCRLSHLLGNNLEAIGCSFPRTRIIKGVFNGKTVPSLVLPGYPARQSN